MLRCQYNIYKVNVDAIYIYLLEVGAQQIVQIAIIYTIDILGGFHPDKYKLLEVILLIFLINIRIKKFLIIESTKNPKYA